MSFRKFLTGALAAFCLSGLPAAAQGILNSYQTVEIKASIWDVWDAVKDFDSLPSWHPVFSDDVLKSGANGEVGTIRTLTVKDGPSFDEELLSYNPAGREYSYRIIDPSPLPLAEYASTVAVSEGRRGYTAVIWRGSYQNGSGGKMTDEEVIAFIDGVYRAGLDNLKIMLEGN